MQIKYVDVIKWNKQGTRGSTATMVTLKYEEIHLLALYLL